MTTFNQNSVIPVNKIAIPTSNGLIFCDCTNIVYCKAESNYTTIVLETGKEVLVSRTLKSFEELLSTMPFVRTHQSFLINLGYIKEYIKSAGGYVVMKNGNEIPVSRNKKQGFLEAISFMLI